MNFRWHKLGNLYTPEPGKKHHNLASHAANPLPVPLHGSIYRVFFNGRDVKNRSSIGAVDIDMKTLKITREHLNPFFEYGPEGSFFSSGVSIGDWYSVGDTKYILFMGWHIPSDGGHWVGRIGRLIITPDFQLKLDQATPFMDLNTEDPISLSYPCIKNRHNKKGFDMWYGSTRTWDCGNQEMLHILKHACSKNGKEWTRTGITIPFEIGTAQAFSRPAIIEHNTGILRMWFSYRGKPGKSYRIGFAESSDGIHWQLNLNRSGIDVSERGWDSEMIEYPYVFRYDNKTYMLYNGNNYGKTGFGIALLEEGGTTPYLEK